MMPMLVLSASASTMLCVVMRTMRSAERSSLMMPHTICRFSGSRPVVGSSRYKMGGEPMTAMPIARRRRMPPESCPALAEKASPSRRTATATRCTSARRVRAFVKPLVRQKNSRCSSTVSSGQTTSNCGTMPSIEPSAWDSESMLKPPTKTWPAVLASMPLSTWIVVVLPAPLGPSSAKVSPKGIVRSRPRTAKKAGCCALPGYSTTSLEIAMAASFGFAMASRVRCCMSARSSSKAAPPRSTSPATPSLFSSPCSYFSSPSNPLPSPTGPRPATAFTTCAMALW
mmetsp:Transcript_6811/g.19701  ORF Transcript_6811/g.19701 Transcript_6811/m.19701 type:complete len:285 (+) Transcript_6811:588-1442(+)